MVMMESATPVTNSPTSTSTLSQTPTIIVQRKSSAGIIAALLVIALAGGGGVAWFVSQQASSDRAMANNNDRSCTVVPLEGFTVNLADPEENHFLRATLSLAVDRLPAPLDKDKPFSGLPMARIRDSILTVLTVSKAEVLLTPDGKQQLKHNVLEVLQRNVPELGVRDVYFTEFLVQR